MAFGNQLLVKSNDELGASFNTVLYTGNSSTQSITGVGFQPDLVWIKDRDTTGESHRLNDSVRGVGKPLYSNGNFAEGSEGTTGLTAFNSDGFSIGNATAYNNSGKRYVAWNFKAGGAAVTNTDGTITSQVSANPEAGFSIVKFDAAGSVTVGHGLNEKPEIIFFKNTAFAEDWYTSTFLYAPSGFNASYGYLNLTNSFIGTNDTTTNSSVFGSGSPSPNKYIAYCFHSVAGFSKFGSYTGTRPTRQTIYTTDDGTAGGANGFEPAFVMIRRTDTTNSWFIIDNKRFVTTQYDRYLLANSEVQEGGLGTDQVVQFLSNGFSVADGSGLNQGTLIYMAFANQF